MKTITVSVDEETHRLICMRAAEMNMSVSTLVWGFLQDIAGWSVRDDLADLAYERDDEFERCRQRMNEVIRNIHMTRAEFRAADNLPREQLYQRANVEAEAPVQQERDRG